MAAVESARGWPVGVDQDNNFENASRLLSDPVYYKRLATGANPYGDGLATGKMVSGINSYFQ
jgi:UDP-N-acetylglucosamine 2-epimerase (non-hydrolysing)